MRYAALADKRLVAAGLCSSCLRGEAQSRRERVSRRGPRRSRGGRGARALTQERAEITLRAPFKDGRTAAARGRPGERPPSLPAPDASPAMGSLPRWPAPRSTEPDKRPRPASREARTPPTVRPPARSPKDPGSLKRASYGERLPSRGRSRQLSLPPRGWRCGKGEACD